MAIIIKTEHEIELMRKAGEILAKTHEELKKIIKPGISTYEIDKCSEDFIRSCGCEPSFLNYQGYPASICVSVNDEVVHGIPSKERILQEGDIVSLDAGVIYKGYHSDAARTYGVGTIDSESVQLIEVTKQSFFEGLAQCRAGNHINDISKAVFGYVTKRGYSAVRDLVGHGVGAHLHEEPNVPNYPKLFKGPKLKPGMVIAIEPMINIGSYQVGWLNDDWTVVTMDGSRSAHYENTVLITEGDPEILSRAEGLEL